MDEPALKQTAKDLTASGKGILAADESTGTIKKRLEKIGVESNPDKNRVYRQLLFTSPGIEEYLSGVIMFDETIRQANDDGVAFPKLLADRGIIPGIKVDEGKVDMPNFPGEKITEGIDGLRDRLSEYREMGARFTKWRAVVTIGDGIPTDTCINSNAELLARYAAYSQEAGLVPIVEPEVLTDGKHSLEKSEEVTYKTLKEVFNKLSAHKIYLPGMLLKPNWAHPGKESGQDVSYEKISESTLRVLKEVVPQEVPGVVFLSGGASPEESTGILNAMNRLASSLPDGRPAWQLSFSFGRALQAPVLESWNGQSENIRKAQNVLLKRARLNSLARKGEYEKGMEEND